MFSKDSAWARAMNQGAGLMPPVRTPEENQRIANERRANRSVAIPRDVFERWIHDLDAQEGDSLVSDMLFEMRSYLRG